MGATYLLTEHTQTCRPLLPHYLGGHGGHDHAVNRSMGYYQWDGTQARHITPQHCRGGAHSWIVDCEKRRCSEYWRSFQAMSLSLPEHGFFFFSF